MRQLHAGRQRAVSRGLILEAHLAEEVNEDVIMTAIDESTPRMKERKRGWRKQVAWWNDELAGTRKEVVAAKKQLARRRKWSCLVEAEKRYLAEVRTSYVKAIKSAKERSWKDFLECYGVAEGGPASPWGTLYRQAAGKTKKRCFLEIWKRTMAAGQLRRKNLRSFFWSVSSPVMKRMLVIGPISILGNW